jgi:hypothetical protein
MRRDMARQFFAVCLVTAISAAGLRAIEKSTLGRTAQ